MFAPGICNYIPSTNQRVKYKVRRVRVYKLHGSTRVGWIHRQTIKRVLVDN